MGRYKKLISILSLSVMVLGLTIVASAQWRDRRGNNGNYGNDRYNANLDRTIKNLRNSSNNFKKSLDRELDRSRYDGSRFEDNLNDQAKDFNKAAKKLDGAYKNNGRMYKSQDEASRLITIGSQLDRALSQSRITRESYVLQNSWAAIERDLRIISRAYNLNYNGRYGNNNGRYDRNDRNNRNNRRGNNRNDRNRNNRNNRNGRYNTNINSTISNLKVKSRRLEDQFDRRRDRNNRSSNRTLERLTDRFKSAIGDLDRENYNRNRSNNSDREVRKVLQIGEQIDRELAQNRYNRNITNEWRSIEQDLRTLANAYNVSYNGRSNNRRSRAGIGDIIRNFPF